jgi:hypothetical protein
VGSNPITRSFYLQLHNPNLTKNQIWSAPLPPHPLENVDESEILLRSVALKGSAGS